MQNKNLKTGSIIRSIWLIYWKMAFNFHNINQADLSNFFTQPLIRFPRIALFHKLARLLCKSFSNYLATKLTSVVVKIDNSLGWKILVLIRVSTDFLDLSLFHLFQYYIHTFDSLLNLSMPKLRVAKIQKIIQMANIKLLNLKVYLFYYSPTEILTL